MQRYYSNAFTDTLKQDALNVFLGCFQPNDSSTPLWDLDSDYNLHNHSLSPPPPLVNKVLFSNLYLDSYALSLPTVRQLVESSIKKALTDETCEAVALVPVNSKKRLKKVLQSEDLTIRTDKIADVVAYIRDLDIPEIDRVHLLKSYFLRNYNALQQELHEASQQQDGAASAEPDSKGDKAHAFPSKMQLKIAIRNIGRLEKRKFLRTVASRKISSVAGVWWKSALQEYEDSLYGTAPQLVRVSTGRAPRPIQKPPSYFHRVYSPYELSEFDTLLSLDFFAPIDAANDITELSARPGSVSPNHMAGSPGAAAAEPVSAQAPTAAAIATARAALMKKFDREYLLGTARANNSYAVAHMHDEYPAASVPTNQDFTYNVNQRQNSVPRGLGGAKSGSTASEGYYNPADQNDQSGTSNAGFQIARYMRKLVGGFLRKEDNPTAPTSVGKPSQKSRSGKLEWDWYHHMINYPEHRVSRKTSQLYSRYEAVAQNNLLLMERMGNQRLAEEEYFILLRDYNIDADNVTGMEHLSIESYVSSEINQGVYQGMQQRESAIAAHSFLMTSLVQVETELQQSVTNLPSSQAREPFVPVPVAAAPKGRSGSSPLKRGQHVGILQNSGVNKADSTMDIKTVVRHALQRHPTLETHLEQCLSRVDHVRGLERELRKNVSDYIGQQSTYAKEISYDHVSTRLSSTSSESSIVEYCMLYDHLSLAKDLADVEFLASCHPAYESFEEFSNLRQILAPLASRQIKHKEAIVKKRAEEIAQAEAEAAAAAAATSASADATASVSEQLGLGGNIAGLQEDLKTDYSLDRYNHPFPYLDNIALPGLSQPGQEFFQLDYDLYVRSTNPFMQLNEAAASSLVQTLSAY